MNSTGAEWYLLIANGRSGRRFISVLISTWDFEAHRKPRDKVPEKCPALKRTVIGGFRSAEALVPRINSGAATVTPRLCRGESRATLRYHLASVSSDFDLAPEPVHWRCSCASRPKWHPRLSGSISSLVRLRNGDWDWRYFGRRWNAALRLDFVAERRLLLVKLPSILNP
jgi:hypothetical protein